MGIFGQQQSYEKFLFLPKQGGEPITVTILGEITRVKTENKDFSYKMKDMTPAGYYDVLPVVNENTGEEIKLHINVWKFYFELKKLVDLDVGDTIEIGHPAKSTYTITKK